MRYLLGSGGLDGGWTFLVFLTLVSVVVLIGYLIAGAAGLVKKKPAKPVPAPRGRAAVMALVTLLLGAVLIRNVYFPDKWRSFGDYEMFVIILSAPVVLVCFLFLSKFKNKKG